MAVKIYSDKERHEANLLRGLQIVLICFSLMFLFILYNGWSSLFSHNNAVVATLGAGVLAFLAWNLGRYIGMSEGGISRHWPIFALLLILSAAGVFNWMMINLEGRTIFLEAVASSEDAFTNLEASAKKNVGDTALAAKEGDVKNKEQLFLAEVRNPLNCGYGPVARERLRELIAVLPDLRLPSPPAGKVSRSPEQCGARADTYRDAIDQEWNSSQDGKNLNAVRTALSNIIATIDQTNAQLEALRSGAHDNGVDFVLGAGRNGVENANEVYKKQYTTVVSYAPNPDLPRSLDITTLSRLGEWSQIISVIVSRLDQVSTYVYLALAVFMDFMLIYLFSEYRRRKLLQPNQLVTTSTSVPHLGVGE